MTVGKIFYFGSLALLLMFLSACQEQGSKDLVTGGAGTGEVIATQASLSAEEISQELERVNKLQKQMDEIRATGKVERCGEIEDHTFSTSCEVYTLFDRAKSKKDTAVCDKGTTDEVKDLCRKTIELNLK